MHTMYRHKHIVANYCPSKVVGTTNLLVNLQLINLGRQLGHNLIGSLVKLQLGSDQLGEILERLRSIEHVLHDPDRLLGLVDKLILGLFYLGSLLLRQLALLAVVSGHHAERAIVNGRLLGIEIETSIVDGLSGALSELEVRVEGGAPTRQEALLDT